MSKRQLEMQEREEQEQQSEPNWTLVIVGYFALLAVVIVLLRPLHMSMGGIFFSMVIAGLALALTIFLLKRGIRKLAAMNMTAKDAYHLAIGYTPGERLELEDDEEEEPSQEPAIFIADRDPLKLGERFQPSFHAFLCVMCLIVGIRRSGKSTLLLTLLVELAKYGLPFVLFDTQGEYNGLVSRQFLLRPRLAGNVERMRDLPEAVRGFLANLTAENAYGCGQMVMNHALQLVVNLKGYNDDEAALIMSEIVDGVNDWQESRHNSEIIPFMFFLDEAQKWFPQNRQDKSPDISIETQNLLEEAFIGKVVERGGKNGLGLVAATQRYSRINKSLLQGQWKFYLQQTEEIDLARYKRQGIDPEEAKNLHQGACIAFGPDVTHFTFQARKASVPHEGHTPNAAALAKYTRNLDVESIYQVYPFPGVPTQQPQPQQKQRPATTMTEPMEEQTAENASRQRPIPIQLRQALEKYNQGFTTARLLAPEIKVKKSRANEIITQLRNMGLIAPLEEGETDEKEAEEEE